MSQLQQTLNHLQKLYDTAGPYYLSDFYKPGGNKRLYDFLLSVYQIEYKNNFRILIIQDCSDVYDYDDLPGQAVCGLQKHLRDIDISNFFVLLLTGNSNIETELTLAQKLYSTDDRPIQSQIIDIDYVKNAQACQDTFCILPWIHLYIGPDSNVLPCCVADQQFPMGSINSQSATEILNSTKFTLLRQNMLNNKRSKECSRCYAQEDSGIYSARQSHNARWLHKKINFNKDGTVEKFTPCYLDIRLSNICNLKCRMCSSYFSSSIAQEDIQLFGNHSSIVQRLVPEQKIKAFDEIVAYLPYIEKIYFAGGEPLLSSEHYKILNALIDCNNVNLEITYNTNFTTLYYKNTSVIDLWNKFSNVTVMASLDAIGQVAEYVRHGTDWDIIESNLSSVKSRCPHVKIEISSTVGFLNVSSLIELQQRWHTQKLLDISNFFLSIMLDPEHLTVCVLPAHHKKRLEVLILDHIKWCKQTQALMLSSQWEKVLTYMNSKDLSHLLPEFKRLTNIKDQHRNESLTAVLPEYQDLLAH